MYKLLPLSDKGYTPLQRLLDQLNSRDPTVQADALRDARALPPDDLLRLVVLERSTYRTRRKQGMCAYIATYMPVCLLSFHFTPKEDRGILSAVQAAINITFILSANVYQIKYERARKHLVALLQEVEDVRFIPHLFRAAEDLSNREICETLKRLLPQVRADHAPMWSKADKATLLLPFKDAAAKDPQLAIACLKALEQIGDTSAVPAVKKLQAQAFAGNRQTLWNAASQCLLYLESNSGKFQQAETLLRSSDIAQVQPDILLRPAADADNSAGEQLLRPGISNDAP